MARTRVAGPERHAGANRWASRASPWYRPQIAKVQLGAGLQHFDQEFRMLADRSEHQRGLAVAVPPVGIGSGREEQAGDVDFVSLHGIVEDGATVGVGRVQIRCAAHEFPDPVLIALLERPPDFGIHFGWVPLPILPRILRRGLRRIFSGREFPACEFMPLGGGQPIPVQSPGGVDFGPPAVLVNPAEVELCPGVPLFCGRGKPAHCRPMVLGHAAATAMQRGQLILSFGDARFGRLFENARRPFVLTLANRQGGVAEGVRTGGFWQREKAEDHQGQADAADLHPGQSSDRESAARIPRK